MLAPYFSLAVAALFSLGFWDDGANFDWLHVIVDSDEGEVGRDNVDPFHRLKIFRKHFEANLHRSLPDTINRRLKDQGIASLGRR